MKGALASRPGSPSSGLTDWGILTLFLPLALTSTMMSLSVPVINAGLSRLSDPEGHLASFAIAFSMGLLLESPVFAVQQATIAWYGGSGAFRPFLEFALALGLLMMCLGALVAFTPAASFLFERVIGAPPALTPEAVAALKASVLFPPLVSVRNALQGLLVARRTAVPITVGTLIRLSVLGILVFYGVPRSSLPPSAAANFALALAVLAETVFVAVAVRRSRERTLLVSPAQEAGRSLGGRVRFLLPLAATMTLATLTNPIINAFVSRSPDPRASLAAYGVVQSLVWFLASPALRYSSVTIALGETAEGLRRLRFFLWRVVGGLCAAVFVVTASPASGILLEDLMGLPPEIAARARLPLVFLSLQPLITGFIAFHQGVLTRRAKTKAVGMGTLGRIVVIGVLGAAGLLLSVRGEVLGSVLLGSAFAAELLVLLVLRWRLRPAFATR